MLSEFKTFIMRGNVVDLAVGVIIGASFGAIEARADDHADREVDDVAAHDERLELTQHEPLLLPQVVAPSFVAVEAVTGWTDVGGDLLPPSRHHAPLLAAPRRGRAAFLCGAARYPAGV